MELPRWRHHGVGFRVDFRSDCSGGGTSASPPPLSFAVSVPIRELSKGLLEERHRRLGRD